MSDHMEQVTSDQDPLTKLIGKIPGFSGYIERQSRRAADKLLRESIGKQYRALWNKVGDLQQDLASDGELEYLDDLEKAAMKIQTFIDKITGASYGYSGFFDAVKINEEELAQLYAYDLALLDLVDGIGRAIENVDASRATDGMPASISHLVNLTRELVSAYEGRNQVLVSVN